jgi:4'-phosphopantetheinyl transferase EntD
VRSELVVTPHGRCALVGDAPGLSPRELGRAALRAVMDEPELVVDNDDRGAPVLPAGWVGSIAHKRDRAAALAAVDDGARVGVDLEHARAPRGPIEHRVLTERELAVIREPREVTLYFAIKEAIYKAVDPFVRRYVGFHEVELALEDAGIVVVTSALPLAIEAWWREHEGCWLATARARLKHASGLRAPH